MTCPEDSNSKEWDIWRDKIIGLGDRSQRKTYYPELRRKLEELRESEQDLRILFDSVYDAILIHDYNGFIVDVNTSMLTMFGISQEESQHLTLADYLVENDLRTVFENIQRVARDRSSVVFEVRVVRPNDGRELDAEIALKPICWKQCDMLVAVVRDITERKQQVEYIKRIKELLEMRVLERTEQLQAANAELESFAYSVSHDLRAPIRSIRGFSEALANDCINLLDDAGKEYLNRIQASAERMNELIEGLLVLSRIMQSEFEVSMVDLSGIASDIGEELRQAYPHHSVTFVVEPDICVLGDRRLLRSLLQNLIENAWKFTSFTANPTIEFKSSLEHQERVFHVADNGIGFDMTYAAKLFGAFQRLQSGTDSRGCGIGLATSQRIVHRHGGRIWAMSEPNKGACFSFTIRAKALVEDPSTIATSELNAV